MTKMNWDRVHMEDHIYRANRGSYIRALSEEEMKRRGLRRLKQSEKWGKGYAVPQRALDRWPKGMVKTKMKSGQQTCPNCGRGFYGVKQHRKDKHGVDA